MKLSRKMQRLLEIKIVRSIKAETGRISLMERNQKPESNGQEQGGAK